MGLYVGISPRYRVNIVPRRRKPYHQMIRQTDNRGGGRQPAHFYAGVILAARLFYSYSSVLYFNEIIAVVVIYAYDPILSGSKVKCI